MLTKVLSTSIIAGIFLIGCGGTMTDTSGENLASMPHQVDMTPKTSREFDPAGEEYLNFIKSYNLNSRVFTLGTRKTTLNDFNGRNQDLNYVFYYDTDHDKNTGYYDKWVPNVGADYLYEDGIVYKYTGTPGSHEWSWEATTINEINGPFPDRNEQVHPNHKHSFVDFLGYGLTLNPNWTQNKFLGFYDTSTKYLETNFHFNEETNRDFRATIVNGDIYLHSYRKDKKKISTNEKYYNYTFTIMDKTYKTEGNVLLDNSGRVIRNNLIYEVRDYDTVTVIPVPQIRLLDGPIKINSVEIRDNNWNQLLSVTGGYSISSVTTKEQLQEMIKNGEDVRNLDVSRITDMSFLFYANSGFNQDISGWDVSNVTNMDHIFANAYSFNQPIGNWNISNVTNMNHMFQSAFSFNQPIGNWNVSNVTNMTDMFFVAYSFNQDISNWDVSNVTRHVYFSERSPLQENYKPHFR